MWHGTGKSCAVITMLTQEWLNLIQALRSVEPPSEDPAMRRARCKVLILSYNESIHGMDLALDAAYHWVTVAISATNASLEIPPWGVFELFE